MTRRVALFLTFILCTIPADAARHVSVAELETSLAEMRSKSDADQAWQIAGLELTERLTADSFSRLQNTLPGEKSKQALLALADQSAFLAPPAAELPSRPAPDLAEQRRIMGLVVAYVRGVIPQLPNLLATRSTLRFRDIPSGYREQGRASAAYVPLHLTDQSSVTVSYRDGKEEDANSNRSSKANPLDAGLRTWGEFGPILTTVLLDAAQNKLGWSRWEQDGKEVRAVFAYDVPREKSHYQVNYCCIANSESTRNDLYRQTAGYHGTMAVDPATGTIVRLTIEADLKAGEPVARAAVLVEYGPVEIGGKTYICPVRALALSRAQSETTDKDIIVPAGPRAGGAMTVVHTTSATQGAEQTLLNDTAFAQYHVFRAESRIVTEASAGLAPKTAEDLARGLPPLGSPEANSSATEPSAVAPTTPASANPGAVDSSAVASAGSSTKAGTAPPPAPPPAEPETTVTLLKGLPDLPVPEEAKTGMTLRTTTHLVDVTLMAHDKKGRPVTDLKADELELYDNERKQQIRFFSSAATETAPSTGEAQAEPSPESDTTTFTNKERETPEASPENTPGITILLIDASNLAFGDLTNARTEILRFLKTLAPQERIGLYIMRSHGLDILHEPTLDHGLIAATLAQWMPNSQDLAHAQEEERRNRQDIEYVHSVGDLLYLNGNVATGESEQGLAIDPQLRSLGNSPSSDALILFPAIARHLATTAGHKTLVWVSSDNVLADWSNNAPSIERGSKNLDPLVLRAQETLNEAHVSVYPLDASQLEAGGVAASTASSNAQVNPASLNAVQAQLAALPGDMKEQATEELNKSARNINPGRLTAQLQANTHPIQGTFRELAAATGGQALRRAGDIAAELNNVIADGHAAYTLSFAPDVPADDQYHVITVKSPGRRDITLRYRAGYVYSKEPASFKDRLRQAIWDPRDMSEIPLAASPLAEAKVSGMKLTIDVTSLALTHDSDRWRDRLDVFLALRDKSGLHAKVIGHSVALDLLPATYQQVLKDGIPFEEPVDTKANFDSARVIVVDENSGRIGSVTIPFRALKPAS